ncbi:MAG: hypothetical protein ACJZ58_00720 [Nitrososphaerales archaeon]
MNYIHYLFAGFIAGILPTVAMSIFEYPFYKKWGIKGVYELHESEMMFCKLTNREFQNKISSFGLLTHMINGSLLSIPFVFYINLSNTPPTILLGIIYAIVVWTVTLLPVHKLITGESLSKNPFGYKPALVSVFGHVIYGFILAQSYVPVVDFYTVLTLYSGV